MGYQTVPDKTVRLTGEADAERRVSKEKLPNRRLAKLGVTVWDCTAAVPRA